MQRENTVAIQAFYAIADTLIAGILVVGVLAVANLGSMHQGLQAFLNARVTVRNAILSVAFLLVWHFLFRLAGVYVGTGRRNLRQLAHRLVAASTLASFFVFIFPATSRSHAFTWPLAFYFWILATAATITLRVAARALRKYVVEKPHQVIIVGSGPKALSLCREMQNMTERHYRVLGFVDSPNGHLVPEEVEQQMLGPIEHLDQILMKRVVDHVMIALPIRSCYDDIQRSIAVCEQAGVESEYLSDAFDLSVAHAQYGNLDSHPIVRLKVVEDDYRLIIKRLIDVVGACVGLVCFAPVMLGIAVMIKLTSCGPAMFAQERYGRNKRCFRMYKFRTMVPDAEKRQAELESLNEAPGPVFKIRKDPRITPIGRMLRKTSLDELPQFFNVLLGEMSLVGPRPLPKRDVSKFDDPSLMRRFSVKPGLTCLWQVNGRSDTDFDHWIELDLEYIDTWSLMLDLSILARTVPAVLKGQGAA